MATPTKSPTAGLGLFLSAAILTFGCITIMQFLEQPWFFMVLVLMHAGIALFVVSKRAFRNAGYNLLHYFKMEYVMLLPFLLIMFYSIASKIGILPPFGTAKASITFILALACFAVTFWNFRHMQRDARLQSAKGTAPEPATSHQAGLVAD